MRYVDCTLPTQRLSFYLSMEEFAARYLPPADYFFMWQVEPSVIFGRNQVIENEVNIPYCQEHNIKMYRRKSGGGCVYADMSNVMLSYITPEDNVTETFARYLNMICETLQTIGLNAHPSGNNDIMLPPSTTGENGGEASRKVSGNAIYHIPGRIIAHGTLLYDTDMEHMLNAITPSHAKLSKHGVESVRQRICLLKDYTTLPLEEIKQRIRAHLCDSSYTLTEDDIAKVKDIEKDYLKHDWIFNGKL